MARIPTVTTEFRTSPGDPGAEFRADFTGPVANARGLAQGLARVGQNVERRFEREEAERNREEDFNVQRRFVEFQTEQNLKMRESWDAAPPGAFGLTSTVQSNYETSAREFFKTVPDRLRSEYDLRLARLAGQISVNTQGQQSQLQESYYTAEVKSALDDLYEQVSEGSISYEDGVLQGRELIDAAGLRELTKYGLEENWTEQAAIGQWNREFTLDPQQARIALGGGTLEQRTDYQFDRIALAVEQAESSGNTLAESSVGASGLMQVMPATARGIAQELQDSSFPIGGTDEDIKQWLKIPENGRRYGRYYLNKRLKQFDGDLEAALIAYNAGASRAEKWLENGRDWSVLPSGVQRETLPYTRKILGSLGLSPTDGPVSFATAGPANSVYLDIPYDERQRLLARAEREMNSRLALERASYSDMFNQEIEFMLDNGGQTSPDFSWNAQEVRSLWADNPIKARNMVAEFQEAQRDGRFLSQIQGASFEDIQEVIAGYEQLLREPGRNIEENKSLERYDRVAKEYLRTQRTELVTDFENRIDTALGTLEAEPSEAFPQEAFEQLYSPEQVEAFEGIWSNAMQTIEDITGFEDLSPAEIEERVEAAKARVKDRTTAAQFASVEQAADAERQRLVVEAQANIDEALEFAKANGRLPDEFDIEAYDLNRLVGTEGATQLKENVTLITDMAEQLINWGDLSPVQQSNIISEWQQLLTIPGNTELEQKALEGLMTAIRVEQEGFEADGAVQAQRGSQAVREAFQGYQEALQSQDQGQIASARNQYVTVLDDYYDFKNVPYSQRNILPNSQNAAFVENIKQAPEDQKAAAMASFLEPWLPDDRRRVIAGLDKAGLPSGYVVAGYTFSDNPVLAADLASVAELSVDELEGNMNRTDLINPLKDALNEGLQDFQSVFLSVSPDQRTEAVRGFNMYSEAAYKIALGRTAISQQPEDEAASIIATLFDEGVINLENKKLLLPMELNTNSFENRLESALDRLQERDVLEAFDLAPIVLTGIGEIDVPTQIESLTSTGTWLTQRDQTGVPVGAVLHYRVGNAFVPVENTNGDLLEIRYEDIQNMNVLTNSLANRVFGAPRTEPINEPSTNLAIEDAPLEDALQWLTR